MKTNLKAYFSLTLIFSMVSCGTLTPRRQEDSQAEARRSPLPDFRSDPRTDPRVQTEAIRVPPPPMPTTGPVDDSVEGLKLEEIQTLYQSGKYDDARKECQAFEKQYARSPQIQKIYNLHGLTLIAVAKPQWAIAYFQEALKPTYASLPDAPKMEPYIKYNLATAFFRAGRLPETRETLAQIDQAALDDSGRVKTRTLQAQLELREAHPLVAANELLLAAPLFSREAGELQIGAPTFRLVENTFKNTLQSITDTVELEKLAQTHPGSSLGDHLLYRIATLQEAAGSKEDAARNFKRITEQYPLSSYFTESFEKGKDAEWVASPSLLEGHVAPTPEPILGLPTFTDRVGNKIGVLLPLSGKFKSVGERTMEAIRMGFRIEEGNTNQYVELVPEDAGETPDSARAALDRLIDEKNVLVVLGPLMSKGADDLIRRAASIGVPLVTLAQSTRERNSVAIQSAVTPAMQARDIAKYAVENEKAKRFAILHPQNKFGEEYAQAFWDAVLTAGGEVVAKGSYAPNETDFRIAIDKLIGLHDLTGRKEELDALEKTRKELNITKRTRKTEKYYQLPPKVEYDAIFIPDDAKAVGQILATFRYRDVQNLKYLGISTWNTPELIKRAGQAAEGSFFTDFFFQDSPASATKKFIQRYQEKMSEKPEAVEALAYDAAMLLDRAFRDARGNLSRAELWKRLTEGSELAGATGKITIQNYAMARKMRILSVIAGRIVEVE